MKKKISKVFTIADYLEEEKFLEDQHRNGWQMVKLETLFSTYVFESCEPEEYVYQLDFNQNNKDEASYLQLFEDCGWKYFNKYGNWYYFRKLKDKMDDDNSIFSDAVSRAEMARKIKQTHLAVIVSSIMPFFAFLNPLLENRLFTVVFIVYLIVMVIVLIINLKAFLKLNRIMREEK